MRRKITLLVLAALTATAGLFVTATPASAQSLGDPRATGCWNSNTWWSPPTNTVEGPQLWLLYSPTCNTNWAVYTGCTVDVVYVQNVIGDRGDAFVGGCAGYTTMVYGGVKARAAAHTSGTGWFWTYWY
jgi:hypothetical protein